MANTRILVVEDEILIAREIEDHLCGLDYEVVGIAADAESALQQVAATLPDLVLMDIVIQGSLDGIGVAAQIHDRFCIPVIYLTAYADDKILERAKQTQPFGYLLKPFTPRGLQAAIEMALCRHQVELEAKGLEAKHLNRKTSQTEKNNQDLQNGEPLEYLSMLSHELRNPITIIKLSTKMLEAFGEEIDEDRQQQLLQRIQFATDSMNELIEDVLTLRQAEYESLPFFPHPTNIVRFCETLVETIQWSDINSCTVDLVAQVDHIYACIDKKLLWHLLSNLLSNAVKYSPQNSTVTLRLSCTDTQVCIDVQDQGIGIAPEDLTQLFQPFYRGKNVGKLPGTGLGLAIAKRAAQRHSGEISVQSQIGYGTTFTVRLPMIQQIK